MYITTSYRGKKRSSLSLSPSLCSSCCNLFYRWVIGVHRHRCGSQTFLFVPSHPFFLLFFRLVPTCSNLFLTPECLSCLFRFGKIIKCTFTPRHPHPDTPPTLEDHSERRLKKQNKAERSEKWEPASEVTHTHKNRSQRERETDGCAAFFLPRAFPKTGVFPFVINAIGREIEDLLCTLSRESNYILIRILQSTYPTLSRPPIH